METDLAGREHENLLGMTGLMATLAPGGVRRRDGGTAIAATGIPVLLFNQLMITSDDPDPAAIAGGVALLRERGAPFVVNLRDGTDDGCLAVIRELGLVPLS
jgi:hypothetical protein